MVKNFMIFIATSWSETMFVSNHILTDLKEIDEDLFKKLAVNAYSCIDKKNLAKILGVKFNPEHVQLRPGDTLLKVVIRGGKLSPYDEELPENVFLEFYCYTVFDANTHVITEKCEEEILMEE